MNPTVLIVDDEPTGREAMESVLTNQGYQLAFASSGSETLTRAQELSPDLILLDVMMPGMDGFEVCRQLRATPRLSEMPVLLVTALDDRESRLMGIEAGADDFITKPVDRMELRARVRTITRLNRYRRMQEDRARLERQLAQLTALRTIDLAITASFDLRVTLDVLVQQVVAFFHVDAAAVALYNSQAEGISYRSCCGFNVKPSESCWTPPAADFIARAMQGQHTQYVPDLAKDPSAFTRAAMLQVEDFRAYCVIPLLAKGQLKGILEVFHREPLVIDSERMGFLETVASQAAIAIDNAELVEGIRRSNRDLTQAYDATIEGWSRALDLRDEVTEGHTQRVTEMTLRLARAVGIHKSEMMHIRRGALLHDIGKLGIPDNILNKPGALTDEEWVIMRRHPLYAFELLSPIAYLKPALDIPLYHHERYNGCGYPYKLKGEQIPLAARLFAVVDVWDALSSDRPYRPGWPKEKVKAYLEAEAGIQFDPAVVETFITLADW